MRGLKPFNPLSLAIARDQQEKDKHHKPEDDLDGQTKTELDALASRIIPGG